MIIHNFYAWIKLQLDMIVFVKHNFRKNSPSNCTLIKQSGGMSAKQFNRKETLIQILVRNESDNEAFKIINTIYDLIRYQFMITLPQTVIDSITYPAVIAAQITPNQLPGGIGQDNEGRYLYSLNITIISE